MNETFLHPECNNCHRLTTTDPFEVCDVYWTRPKNDKNTCPIYKPYPTMEIIQEESVE